MRSTGPIRPPSSGIFCDERLYLVCLHTSSLFVSIGLPASSSPGLNFQVFEFKKDVEFLDGSSIKLIFYASLVSVFCAVLWLYGSNYKLLTRLMQWMKATKRYGDEDVWDFTFNSGRPEVEYIHLRDFEKKITYAGWVEAFSETEQQRELRLRDVIVYDFEGNVLFETARVYLARKMDNIDIEFPYRPGATE
jgi:hypothetical protein